MWKNRCANCVCLVENDDKDWYCDEVQIKCILIDECPYENFSFTEEEEDND